MISKIIAQRYGQAFINYAKQTIAEDAIVEESQSLYVLFDACPDFVGFLQAMQITYRDKCDVIEKVLLPYHESFRILLRLLLDKQRIDHLFGVLDYIRTMRIRANKIQDALVITRFPIDDDALRQIKERLEQRLKRKLTIRTQLNSSYLGGVRVVIGGETIIDGSVKKRFTDLSRKLQNAKM